MDAYRPQTKGAAWRVREKPPRYRARARPKLYLETTIASYLTARPSRDPQKRIAQRITRMWWEHDRHAYELYVSTHVIAEAELGHRDAARRRLSPLARLSILAESSFAETVSAELLRRRVLPARAAADAMHVAIAAANQMTYVLTWNCSHLANPQIASRVAALCEEYDLRCPTICTPVDLIKIQTREARHV